jgi:hypothetical protein
MYIQTSKNYDADYLGGIMVITNNETGAMRKVSLRNNKGHNITLAHFKDCIASHGFDNAAKVFFTIGKEG